MIAMLLALTALLAPQAGYGAARDERPLRDSARWSVDVLDDNGDTLVTIQADNALLFDVLRDIAERSGLVLDGFDASWRKTLVTADLRRRPLRQALTFLLGSVGLRAEVRQGALYLHEGLEASNDADELDQAALASYLRALRDFPEHPLAAEARRSQARIEERHGRPAAARAHYEALIEHHPESALVPEALLHCGVLLMREGAWSEAVSRLSDLLRIERENAYETPGRLELAWCVSQLGEYERALYMIEALDEVAPSTTLEVERRRTFVRIRCLAGLGQGKQALALLDEHDRRPAGPDSKRDSLELRALACESAGAPGDAARAWLALSRLVEGRKRERALREAARLALGSDQELGALFIAALAKDADVDLSDVTRRARENLSLVEVDLSSTTFVQRLERAERLLAASLSPEALSILQQLAPQRTLCDEPLRVRFTLAYGRALASELGLDTALGHFRDALGSVADPEQRRLIYLLAGDLLDAQGRLDDAIEAYRGRI